MVFLLRPLWRHFYYYGQLLVFIKCVCRLFVFMPFVLYFQALCRYSFALCASSFGQTFLQFLVYY